MTTFSYIALEGPEGGGKSTQAQRLARHFAALNLPLCYVQEPGGTPIGQQIRQVLVTGAAAKLTPGQEAILFNAQRLLLMVQVLRPALAQGHVLTDRTALSTLVYQGCARGGAGVPPEVLHYMVEEAVGGTWPHLTIVLDVPAATGLERKGKMEDLRETRFESMGLSFHEQVRQGYLAYAHKWRERVTVVDATQPPDQVFAAILDALAQRLGLPVVA